MSDKIKLKAKTKKKSSKKSSTRGKAKPGKQTKGAKYENISENMFAAYFHGHSPKDIAEMFNVPLPSVYTRKRRDNWDARKDQVNDLAKQKSDIDLATQKADMIKIVKVLINQSGQYLMELGQQKKAGFKTSDLVNLIKTHQLLTGEATERFGIYDKEMVREMVREMSPAERGVVLTLFEKIERKMQEDQTQKEGHLKLVN